MTSREQQLQNLEPVPEKGQAGFTLLETLISLAILSVVSLALFQSTSALLHITDRAVFAGERTVEAGIARKTFRASIGGLTPAWREDVAGAFQGDARQLSGLSTDVPTVAARGLQSFSLSLVPQNDGKIVLTAMAGGQTWPLREFAADTAKFVYLGADRQWHERWPPRQIPSPGFFDDVLFMDMPKLPLAVRLHGKSSDKSFDWVASVLGSRSLPYREDIE